MMRRLLLTGHLDGKAEALTKLKTLVRERQPDGILFAGGFLARESASHAEKRKMWTSCLDGFGALGVFTAVIPGASEAPLREFLRPAKEAEITYPNLHIAHGTLFEEGDVAICGLGGDLAEGEDCTEDRLCYARATAEFFLRMLWQAEQPHKILLLSAALPGQLGGESGNRICGDFIDSYHPSLCLVAGTSERRGLQRIARTLVVNPGQLADGSAAWLDWNRHRDEQVELLRL
jgi:hypothetical protein